MFFCRLAFIDCDYPILLPKISEKLILIVLIVFIYIIDFIYMLKIYQDSRFRFGKKCIFVKKSMATTQDFADYILDQIDYHGIITYRKMFGEYAVYADGKVVALIADNKLYVKPTEGGRIFIGEVTEAPAYPGAKMSFLIEDQIDDRIWISKLIEITALEIPEPKPKKKKIK